MVEKHLTDEEIQDYLDKDAFRKDPSIEHHFQACRSCCSLLKRYERLYIGLGKDPGFEPAENFVESILSKLSEQSQTGLSSVEKWLAFAGILTALVINVYFLFLNVWTVVLKRMRVSANDIWNEMLFFLHSVFSELNRSLFLFFFAGMAVLFVALLDHYIFKQKSGNHTIFTD